MLHSAFLILTLFLGPDSALVQPTWHCPDVIQSSGDGSFYARAVFVAGTGGAAEDYSSVIPSSNVTCCLWTSDGYCEFQVAEGDTIDVPIFGMLDDLHSDATLEVRLGVCNAGSGYTDDYTSSVRVYAPVVPVETSSIGLVKSMFRR